MRVEWMVQLGGMALTFHCVCLTLVFVEDRVAWHAWTFTSAASAKGEAHSTDLMALWYVILLRLVVALH